MSRFYRFTSLVAVWLVVAIFLPVHSEPLAKVGQPPTVSPGEPLPPGAIARMGTSRIGPLGFIRSLTYSKDGARLISTSLNDVRIWNARDGKELQRFSGFPGREPALRLFAVSPDQKGIAAGIDGEIEIWDLRTGEKVRSWEQATSRLWPIVYSPNGKMLASKDLDGVVRLSNAETGKEIHRFKTSSTIGGAIAFSPDSQHIAFCQRDRGIRLAATDTGNKVAEFSAARKKAVDFLYSLRFSPDGKTLAAVTISLDEKIDPRTSSPLSGASVVLWDTAGGQELKYPSGSARASADFVFSQDSRKLLLGGRDGNIYVWDLVRQRETGRFATNAGPVLAMALSPDDKTLATAGSGVAIRQWNVATGKEVRWPLDGHRDKIAAAAFSPDGKILATLGEDRTLRLWDTRTGQERQRIEGVSVLYEWPKMVSVLGFSPDSRLLIVNCDDSSIRFWDVQTGKHQRSMARPPHRIRSAMCLSSDGKTLAVCDKNDPAEYFVSAPRIVLYDVQTGRQLDALPGPSASVFHLTFCKGDALLLSASFAGSAKRLRVNVLDAKTGDEFRHFDFAADGEEPQIAFAPDAHWAAVQDCADAHSGGLYQVRFYDLAKGKETRRTPGYWKPLHSLISAADGRALAGISADDGRIHYWEAATAGERRVFEGHRGGRALCFSREGTLLASAGDDTTALVWEIAARMPPRKEGLTTEELGARWSDLAGDDAVRAAAAMWTLVGFPQQTLPFLRKQLRPIPAINPQELSRLIADLKSDLPAVRKQAFSRLEQLGEVAAPALREALRSARSASVQRLIILLLEETDPVVFVPTVDKLRTSRALEILEHLGTPQARDFLSALAHGAPEAAQTQEAQAAIERLANRPSARDQPPPGKR